MSHLNTEFVLVSDEDGAFFIFNKRGHQISIEDPKKHQALVDSLKELGTQIFENVTEFRKAYPSLTAYVQTLFKGPRPNQEVIRVFVDWRPYSRFALDTRPTAHAYLKEVIMNEVGHRMHNVYFSEHSDTFSAVVIIEGNDYPQEGYDLRSIPNIEQFHNVGGFKQIG